MDFSSLNKSRRSIRDFKLNPVTEGVLNELLEDALWSPSQAWRQNFEFFIAPFDRLVVFQQK